MIDDTQGVYRNLKEQTKKEINMKKIMVALVAIALAASSQAANWKWEISSSSLVYAYGSTSASKSPLSGSTAYIFLYTSSADQAAVFDQWYNGGSYGVTSLSGYISGSGKTVTDGLVSTPTTTEFTTSATSGTQKFFFALIDEDGDLLISSTKSGSVSTLDGGTKITFSAGSVSLADRGTATSYSLAGWYAPETVPEPTSGLLLLLGMAGLALKRKRA